MDIYYKVVSYAIIGNAQKNLLTVAKATFVLLFPVLDLCLTHFTVFHNETTCGFRV